MCDESDFGGFDRQRRGMSRRSFGTMAIGAGLGISLPRIADAAETAGADVEIKTSDGTADAYFVHPKAGRHPGVLIWPDILGLRPAFRDMATRLAEGGYAVLVVNPFYRSRRAPTAPQPFDFGDRAMLDALMKLKDSLTPETTQVDARAFVAFLDQQSLVDATRGIGTTGYCMGGPLVLRTAASIADRVGAGATFHGGGLVTDKLDSPHLLIPKMKAQVLIAVAENDDAKEPAAKGTLRDAFAAAKLPAEIEVYAGTRHGWCLADSPVYDHDQAERAWSRLLALFKRAL